MVLLVNNMERELELINEMIIISDIVSGMRNYGQYFKHLGDSEVYVHMERAAKILVAQYSELKKELDELKKKPVKAMFELKVVDKED